MVTTAQESKPVRKISTQNLPYFTLPEFEAIAELLPYRRLELIKGAIKVFPPPDKEHQYVASRFNMLCAPHAAEVEALGCFIAGSTNYFEVPESFLNEESAGPSNINPDATICYQDY
jgi:hypothetical protein